MDVTPKADNCQSVEEIMETEENKDMKEKETTEGQQLLDENTNPEPSAKKGDEAGNNETSTTQIVVPIKKVVPPELPLDWTNLGPDSSDSRPIRYPADVMDFSKDDTYLEIIGTAGQKITHMGKSLMNEVSPEITELIFRSHLISKMEGIRGMKKLELLELYDNQIEYLDELDGPNSDGDDENSDRGTGFNLKTLDMSYNVIRDMEPVIHCPNLVELYLANNKIKKLDGLSSLVNLRKLDLGANRIREMDDTQLSGLINLEELWLGKNKIEKIQGISALKKLKRLDVQSNRLTSISGLEGQIDSLEELYLAHNGINDEGAMEESGLQLQFKNLTDLDLSKNRLTSCRPFAHLDTLTDLWLSQNEISTYDDIEPISRLGAREGAQLATIYLEHNPIYNDFEYRKKLKEIISSLTQIDADMIGGSGYGSAHLSQAISPDQYLEQMRVLQDTVVARAQVEAEASNADA